MLDRWALSQAKRPLNWMAQALQKLNIHPDHVTLCGFALGLVAFACIALGYSGLGLGFILLNRLADGIDGALARLGTSSDRGGFLDITLDFLFYSLIPLGFVIQNPTQNALAGACVIFAFVGTGSSFLGFAIIAAKRKLSNLNFPQKSFYYLGGLTEASETIFFFSLSALFPAYFPVFAYIFTVLCLGTTVMRIIYGWKSFAPIEKTQKN